MKKRILSLLLAAVMLLTLCSCQNSRKQATELFESGDKMAYSYSYTELSETKTNKTSSWRQGMVSGNGMQGYITSGSPYSDTLIFQNMHFILPNVNVRYCPDTADELETVKQCIVKGEDITDNASYDDVYRFHPGGALRLNFEKKKTSDYLRFTDYSTAETGVRFTDENGTWERRSFTSQADGVSITEIKSSSDGKKVNTVLSFDNISAFANYGDGDEKNLRYKKLAGENGDYLAFVAHYPDYENSELKNGGYATVCYVVCENGEKQVIDGAAVPDAEYAADKNPQIKITDADSVTIITVSDRTYDMGKIGDFEKTADFELVKVLVEKTKAVADKYTEKGGFRYETALKAHLAVYQPLFNAVTLSLDGGESCEPNEALLKAQRGKNTLNSALIERAYYSGRYAYLCCAGYSTSRLYGMWTGEWNTGWGSKYTMDANVNLQTSSMNTSNLKNAPVGYAYFILRQLPDWEENAKATHGFTNAIQAPVNTDGDKAVITETCYPYPFRYWNAGTSWMLQPLYETLECYGDIRIPLSEEFDLNKLKSVLSPTDKPLTDEQVQAIEKRGYLTLEKDILYPLLVKSANYWAQLMTAEYYTDADGNIHYEKGKKTLSDNEYYCILPSYSPENTPDNYPSPSVANAAIDIAACRSNLEMLLAVAEDVAPGDSTQKWEQLMNKLPPYLFDETGALKEWACNSFEENNEHRHLSHLYGVWPLFETQKDETLKNACIQAIENRESENEASHALVHRSLIAARLKDRKSLTEALTKLMNHKIHYDSLMTNHDYDRGSCYCTDFAIGYLGIINESLVYSNEGEIELLPALPESGFEKGKITGLMTRTEAEIVSLSWDSTTNKATAQIKSGKDQTIKVKNGLTGEEKTVTLKKGETGFVSF